MNDTGLTQVAVAILNKIDRTLSISSLCVILSVDTLTSTCSVQPFPQILVEKEYVTPAVIQNVKISLNLFDWLIGEGGTYTTKKIGVVIYVDDDFSQSFTQIEQQISLGLPITIGKPVSSKKRQKNNAILIAVLT